MAGLALTLAGARAAPVRFDLPAQPASAALVAFARQAGVDVLFAFDELKQVQANAVQGVHEPEAAIALLLRNTGYKANRNAAGKFVVLPEHRRKATGEIHGRLEAAGGGEPVAGARVHYAGAAAGVRSRRDGSFVLAGVPAETQVLVVRADGFVTTRIDNVGVEPQRRTALGTIPLTAGEDLQQLGEVVVNASELSGAGPAAFVLQEVIVSPSRYGVKEERGTIAAALTERDLLALPQVGEDLYRAISHLPGLSADDMTARFWVRGAPHEQVLARLDGVELIEPFHMKDTDSSLSILDLETISRLDLFTGGFTAEFGDRLAGVLVMETDRYVRAYPRTTLGLSLTGARAASRGMTENGRSNWLMSVRSGYPQVALNLRGANSGSEIEPRYHDVMAKWETALTPQHTVSLHALHAADTMHFQDANGPRLSSRYGSDYFWARWQGDLGRIQGEAVLSHAQLAWSRTAGGKISGDYALAVRDERALRTWALRQDWTADISERILLRGGFEIKTGEADYDYDGERERVVFRDGMFRVETSGRNLQVRADGQTAAGYLAARAQPMPEITLETGLRYDENNYVSDSEVSPRFNATWTRSRTTLRAGWGHYHQAQGLHRLAVVDGDATFRRSERAEHRVISLEQGFRSGINLRLEAYERLVRRPQPHWENVVDNIDAVPELDYDRMRFDPVRQRARGIELIVERRGRGSLAWSASYALARAEETLGGGLEVPRARDQHHTVYLDVTYTPTRDWQFSLAWQYHTGWPTTGVEFSRIGLADGGTAILGELGRPYALRLPAYHRLDFRAQRRFELKRGTLRVYADVFNALDRENTIAYAYTVNAAADGQIEVRRRNGEAQFPLLPSVGVTWDF